MAHIDADINRYGSTEDSRSKKNRLVFELIKWTLTTFRISFPDLASAKEVLYQGNRIAYDKELIKYYQAERTNTDS